MNDSISRQAAIDAMIEWYGCEPSDLDYFKKIVEQLPSAQAEIVRCKNCKWWRLRDERNGIRYGVCRLPASAIKIKCWLNEDWFCADGERNTNGDC